MLRVARAGGIIIPASPAFYHKPKSVQEMVDFVVGKVLDALRIEQSFSGGGKVKIKAGGLLWRRYFL